MLHSPLCLVTLMVCLLSSVLITSGSSLCTFEAREFYPHKDVIDCFETIPFNQTIADHTLTQLSKAMESYTFLDIATNPPDQKIFYPKVDLLKEFKKLGKQSFSTDVEFQMAIRDIFLQLHDAHTNYYAPACYQQFYFLQPFSLISYYDNDTNVIEVSPYSIPIPGALDPKDLVGARVLSINGTDAFEYLQEFSSTQVGLAKDPSTRFNIALDIPSVSESYGNTWSGLFSVRPPHFSPPPEEESITYTIDFHNGTTSTVVGHWYGVSVVNFTGKQSFLDMYLNDTFSKPQTEEERLQGTSSVAKDLAEIKSHLNSISGFAREKRATSSSSSASPSSSFFSLPSKSNSSIVPLFNSTVAGVGFYLLNDDTLVMYVNTFLPADYYAFEKTIVDGFFTGAYEGIDKLIIDLTLNGGGDICLGRSILEFLAPHEPNYGPTDMPSSPLAINLTETAVKHNISLTTWSPDLYQTPNQTTYSNDDKSWMIPGVPHVRAGLHRNYSQLVHITDQIGCGYFPFENLQPFNPSQIIMVTHGFCGSTCALFSNHLANYEHVKTAVVGGIGSEKEKQQYSSFPGLQVLESNGYYITLEQLMQDVNDQSCTDCLAPRQLLTTASFRLCIREIYGPNNTNSDDSSNDRVPLEYTWQVADYHIPNTRVTAISPSLVWQQVYGFFFDENW